MDPDAFDRIMQESIAEEIAARDFYRAASLKTRNAAVRAIFEELARDEEGHRNTLETFRFDPVARVEFARVEDFGVSEAEERIAAPSVDRGRPSSSR
jgi:rubrerythrin